ncbi:hypothetical protein [Clostridium sp. KNHs214]|uniref:hypothetical protein n=1 Tax=Clostridium sp. KNHs214 TaxID=1540257 RepID=UPI000553D6D3|nr:hypothetical protein [Clostridium sp. KNHs214]
MSKLLRKCLLPSIIATILIFFMYEWLFKKIELSIMVWLFIFIGVFAYMYLAEFYISKEANILKRILFIGLNNLILLITVCMLHKKYAFYEILDTSKFFIMVFTFETVHILLEKKRKNKKYIYT